MRKTGPEWVDVVRLTDMLLARWLPAAAITQSYAVHEAALFRYSQRGMLGARWDEVTHDWLYDVMRVRELFLHRDFREGNVASAARAEATLGTLGEARLAGAGMTRRRDARQTRQALHVREADAASDAGTATERRTG